jgi:hypothetical protein
MLICKAGIDFSSLKTSPSIPAHFEEEESIIAPFLIPTPPPPHAENQFHNGIDFSQGIYFLESIPWVFKRLNIQALVSVSAAASEKWSFIQELHQRQDSAAAGLQAEVGEANKAASDER